MRRRFDIEDYLNQEGMPYSGIACDASCTGGWKTKEIDGYFHGKVEWQCVDVATREFLFKSDVQAQSTINIGEFMGIVTALKILHKNGDTESPVWSDSKYAINWARGRYTSSNLPLNEFTWEAIDAMEEFLQWLKKEDPPNPILWWNSRRFGEHPADYGRKGAVPKKSLERGKVLVDTFSGNDGSGSVLTTCEKKSCRWPYCLCVTR